MSPIRIGAHTVNYDTSHHRNQHRTGCGNAVIRLAQLLGQLLAILKNVCHVMMMTMIMYHVIDDDDADDNDNDIV